MWELKMCRLALQLLGMLGNVLGRPRHALQRPRHALQGPLHALQGPWPTSACFCKVLGVYGTWWYTTPLASQLIRQQVEGFLFDVGLLGPCKSMPRSAKDLAKHAKDLAKHAEDIAKLVEVRRGRCQACLGVAKQAYTS